MRYSDGDLRTWLDQLDLVRGSLDVEVTEVVYDSRKAVPGAVFACMAGTRVDSHRFVPGMVLRAGVRGACDGGAH